MTLKSRMYAVIFRPLTDFCFVVKKSVKTENKTVDHNSTGGRYEKLGGGRECVSTGAVDLWDITFCTHRF